MIAGAGIGGLGAAIALSQIGLPVVLLEKHNEAPEEGAGIQIGPNGTRILQDLKISSYLKDLITEPRGICIRDGVTGHHLTYLSLGQFIFQKYGSPYWVLHRADLHAAMRSVVEKEDRIDFLKGAEVVSAVNDEDSVCVGLGDGRQIRGCALIAADGLWSTIREQIFKYSSLSVSGKCALRAIIPSELLPASLEIFDTTVWLSPSCHVVHYHIRAGREVAIVAIFNDDRKNETWARSVEIASIFSRIKVFPPLLQNILSLPLLWRKWSIYTLSKNEPWVSGRIALFGDAAHPMLPFLAQGAVMALEDAVVLAKLIKEKQNCEIANSLLMYEKRRLYRIHRVQQASAQNGRIYHLDGLYRVARNIVLKIVPPSILLDRYDWLYGWNETKS